MHHLADLADLSACRGPGTGGGAPILVLDSGGHTSIIPEGPFTPDGKELISVSNDKTIRFWDVASGEPIRVLRPPRGPGNEGMLQAGALSSDGRTLAVGGWGLKDAIGSIYLISVATGRIERVLKGHTGVISSLSFAAPPGGHVLLASGSTDKTARIWDVATGECRRVLEGHTNVVSGVAFAPDASRLATASYDKTADLVGGRWPLPADPPGAHELGRVRCLEPRWKPHRHRRLRSVDPILEPERSPLPKHRESGRLD